MRLSPLGAFAKFTIGFLVFISFALGLTVAVNDYTVQQDQQKQTAAVFQALLSQEQ